MDLHAANHGLRGGDAPFGGSADISLAVAHLHRPTPSRDRAITPAGDDLGTESLALMEGGTWTELAAGASKATARISWTETPSVGHVKVSDELGEGRASDVASAARREKPSEPSM